MTTIEVTQDDIDAANAEGSVCPIQRAFDRMFARRYIIGNTHIHVVGKDLKIPMPKEASEFTYAFDNLADVQPFTFEVNL